MCASTVEGSGERELPDFEDLVRDALLHLYDAAYLQTHPLTQLADVPSGDGAVLRGKRLLQALLDAIESLRPAPGTSTDSRAWRSYRLLELRYVEGLSAGDVLGQLAISKTQYQREHARALEAVASLLWDRWHPRQPAPASRCQPESRESLALTEAEQLADQMNPDYVDLARTLGDLLALLRPVSLENRIKVSLEADPNLPPVYGDRVALRQVFLGLLNTALEISPDGALDISLTLVGESVQAVMTASPGEGSAVSARLDCRTDLELQVARRLVEALGGKLQVKPLRQTGCWSATVTLPAASRPLVLVMDNHPDFVGLARRYLAEHDWQVVGAQDVQQAQSLALELRPSVVLLDVIMPGQDGWDLLLALRSRPETRQIPVIVCSVLYEPQIARALGAVDYLSKPISQDALLKALAPYRPGRPGLGPAC